MVRIKHRYLLLNVLYPDTASSKSEAGVPDFLKFHSPTPQHVSTHAFLVHLKAHIIASFGHQGLGLCLSSLKLVYWSNATSNAILRVPRAHHQIVWASLSYMTEMPGRGHQPPGTKCVVRVVRVSGTIRKAEEELLRRSRRYLVQAKLAGTDNYTAVSNKVAGGEDAVSMPRNNNNEHDSMLPIDDGSEISEISDDE